MVGEKIMARSVQTQYTPHVGCRRPEELCLTFSCGHGVGPEVDLVPQGSQIEVTSSNWREYYKHMLAFKLHKGIEMEVGAVRKGFQHIVDDRTMQLLRR